MTTALETAQLSKRYGRTWALRDCTLALPAGRVAALVGPNGAGKTTLLHLCGGLLEPTAGHVQVFGHSPLRQTAETLPRLSFVAQDHPLYRDFSVADLLTLGRRLNPRWDDALARSRMQKLGIPFNRRTGKLSSGQQAQVALVLALAKRPDLLLLDEPLASLDPLARRDFLRTLTDAQLESGLTVLLSSHIIGDLERVCDYLIILSAAHVQSAGDIKEIEQAHKRLVGPRQEVEAIARAIRSSRRATPPDTQGRPRCSCGPTGSVRLSWIHPGKSRRRHWRTSCWPIWGIRRPNSRRPNSRRPNSRRPNSR